MIPRIAYTPGFGVMGTAWGRGWKSSCLVWCCGDRNLKGGGLLGEKWVTLHTWDRVDVHVRGMPPSPPRPSYTMATYLGTYISLCKRSTLIVAEVSGLVCTERVGLRHRVVRCRFTRKRTYGKRDEYKI